MKEGYYLGVNQYDEKVYLEKPSWDCDWYWGFGYLEAYDKYGKWCSHTHFDSDILHGQKDCFSNFKAYFKETPLTDDEIYELCDYMRTFYILRDVAELYKHGYSWITHRAYIDILEDKDFYNLINKKQLPELFARIEKLFNKGE